MSLNKILSLLGWTFLPGLVSRCLQTIYYSIIFRAGTPHPPPSHPRYQRDRRRIHLAVVSLYLLYTIYEADWELQHQGTFYSDLSLPPSTSEKQIKSRFRRLAAMHHPDKGGTGSGDFYLQLQTAADVLTDPARRFAYDRFGLDSLEWDQCVTIREYLMRGAGNVGPYYAGVAGAIYLMGYLGFLSWGRYWRWYTLAVLFTVEVWLVTRPVFPWLLSDVVNSFLESWLGRSAYLPFQLIELARQIAVTVFIAFSQIGPLLGAPASGGSGAKNKGAAAPMETEVAALELVAQNLEADVARLVELEMAPFAGREELTVAMRGKIKDWLVQNTIRADPMVKDALGSGFRRRRVDAPAGAKGNR